MLAFHGTLAVSVVVWPGPGSERADAAASAWASTAITKWNGSAVDNSTGLAIVMADARLARHGSDSTTRGLRTRNWITGKKAEALMYV